MKGHEKLNDFWRSKRASKRVKRPKETFWEGEMVRPAFEMKKHKGILDKSGYIFDLK